MLKEDYATVIPIWMNMTMNNPHAVEGLFAKSRGVFNEELVWTGFQWTEKVH